MTFSLIMIQIAAYMWPYCIIQDFHIICFNDCIAEWYSNCRHLIRVNTPYANFSHVNVAYANRASRHNGSVVNTPSTPSTCTRGRSLLLWNVGCVEIRQSASSPRPFQQYQLYSPTIAYITPHPFPWLNNIRHRHNKSTHVTKLTTENQYISKYYIFALLGVFFISNAHSVFFKVGSQLIIVHKWYRPTTRVGLQ